MTALTKTAKNRILDVPRTYYTTSWGRTQVPMFFYRMATRMLHYAVDFEPAARALDGTGLVPVRLPGGRALTSLVLFNFRDVTIGPYDEVTITILCHPQALPAPRAPLATLLFRKKGEHWGNLGTYVLEMPVTSAAARAAGREIWGFPKFLTRIPYTLEGDTFAFSVLAPDTDEPIVSVRGRLGAGVSTKAFDAVSFTNYEGSIWRVVTAVDARYRLGRAHDVAVRVGSSEHRLARNVTALGLDTARPFLAVSTDDCCTRLEAGRPIASWPTPPVPYSHEAEREHAAALLKRQSAA